MNENYEDYEQNVDNSEYDEDDKSSRNKKIILTVLIIIGIIIIILLLLRSCGNGGSKEFDYEKTLLDAGKEYYEYNTNEVPKAKSSCEKVSLSKLISEGLIDPDDYENCDGEDTYVKVCLLENGKTHYVPILSCEEFNSDDLYDEFADGDLDDIKEDETDIKYSYMAQVLKKDSTELGNVTEIWYGDKNPYENYKLLEKTTYYRYKEVQYKWYETAKLYYPNDTISAGKELYIVSPANGYTNKDNGKLAYKWYKIVGSGDKIYYDGWSMTAPEGYPYADTTQGYTVASRSRTATKVADPVTFNAPKMYKCIESSYKNQIESGNIKDLIFTNEYYPCGDSRNAHPEHDYEYETFYSCDSGVTKTSSGTVCYKCETGSLRPDNSSCAKYGDWSYSGTQCTGLSDVCENLKTPANYYKWYKFENETRSYYPSGSSTAAGEKTYYTSAPSSEYIKDASTEATAYNWYKNASTLTGNYFTTAPSEGAVKSDQSRTTDWTEWSTTPVYSLGSAGTRTIETKVKLKIQEIKNSKATDYENIMKEYTEDINVLIKAFQDKGYDVKSLEDIAMNGEIKYLSKMQVRNKK